MALKLPDFPAPCVSPFDEVFAEEEVITEKYGGNFAPQNPYEARPTPALLALLGFRRPDASDHPPASVPPAQS